MTTVRVRRGPGRAERAVVEVPGSKSIANRALVCSALAAGTTRLTGLPPGDDTRLLLDALELLGVAIRSGDDHSAVTGPLGGNNETATVDAGHGGTTARFLCALAALRTGRTEIRGTARLLERPMDPLFRALRELGATVDEGRSGSVLATVSGGEVEGGSITVSANVSSQFASALMLVGPMLRRGLRLRLEGHQRSRSYVEMTAAVMRSFGASVECSATEIVVLPGGYSPRTFTVEADYSSAAFPVVAAVLTGRPLVVPGLPENSIQGDSRMRRIAESLACDVRVTDEGLCVAPRPGETFPGLDIDLSNESDLVPPLAIGLLGATSPSTIRGVGFIRGKESNRLEEFSEELARCGVEVRSFDDGLRIVPGTPTGPARLDPRNDHRLAMAFALLPLIGRPDGASAGIEIVHAETVTKSWPGYWSDMSPFFDVESLPS